VKIGPGNQLIAEGGSGLGGSLLGGDKVSVGKKKFNAVLSSQKIASRAGFDKGNSKCERRKVEADRG